MDVAQRFRRLAFIQVVLGVVSFCIAAEDPALLLLVGAIAVLSWYVTEGPSAWGLPRVWVNLAALLAVAWLGFGLLQAPEEVLSGMGRFIMVLQVLILYMRKTNREYAQLLVLSLLQMAVASVLPGGTSVVYGLLLGAYGLVGLMTVLLMHLKVSADQVEEARREAAPAGVDAGAMAVSMGRGHRWQLRGLAVVLAVVCVVVGVGVFVGTPRTESGVLALTPQQNGKQTATVGFSEEIRLGGPPINAGSPEAVLNVAVTDQTGQVVGGQGTTWLLRGAVLDQYDPLVRTWRRSTGLTQQDRRVALSGGAVELLADATASEMRSMRYRTRITSRPASRRHLFTLSPTMGGVGAVVGVRSEHLAGVMFNGWDQQAMMTEVPRGAFVYEVDWVAYTRAGLAERYEEHLGPAIEEGMPWELQEGEGEAETEATGGSERGLQASLQGAIDAVWAGAWRSRGAGPGSGESAATQPVGDKRPGSATGWKVGPDRVRALARSVIRAELRPEERKRPASIARALSAFLEREYRYTLDNPPSTNDPVLAFLFEHKQGHCELFASALAAMCRSVGVPARLVTGYRVSEFNTIGGYYVVRQTDAHAWVEVQLGEGGPWRVVDPTPAADLAEEHDVEQTWWRPVVHLYEHLEYWWLRSVMAYDENARQELIAEAQSVVDRSRDEPGGVLHRAKELWDWVRGRLRLDMLGLAVLGFVGAALMLGLGLMLRLYVLRRRRLAALHLEKLPRRRRVGLVRRLRFYLMMLELLERHGHRRPHWQSPFEFAEELAESDPMRFDPVLALTEQFYAVRFGHREMDEPRRRLVKTHLRQLQANLGESG
ncbi:MAG: transglutaminaseTgpA domain-containing protein [Planctomycetota bacterium]